MRLKYYSVALLVLAACAHEQTKAESTPAPVAEATPPAPAVAPASRPDALQAFLGEPLAHFAFDRADLTDEDTQKLQKLAALLKSETTTRIQIAGNCDERGTDEYNLQLGSRRAEVAKKYLVNLGIDASRIETISYGKDRPIDEAHDERAWALNRRDDGQLLVQTSSVR